MPARGELPSQLATDEVVKTYQSISRPLITYFQGLGEPHNNRFMQGFLESFGVNGAVIRFGTSTYDDDMERAGKNATQRPFGIEMGTLSQSMQLVLYPETVFRADEQMRSFAQREGLQVREEGPQAMLYLLDSFAHEGRNIQDMGANWIFVSHITDALLRGAYPLEQGERSSEFVDVVTGGLSNVQEYIGALSQAQRNSLSPRIDRIGSLDQDGLRREAQRRVAYDVEAMKSPGLIEFDQSDDSRLTPQQAVQNGETYLKLDQRDLPLREKADGIDDVPNLPWREFGKNRWNRSHQIFGRYQAPMQDGFLNIDYRLDSTHMPALYGFFDTIEVSRVTPEGIKEQIILSQEMGENAALLYAQFFGAKLTPEQLQDSVVPIVIAGDYDFSSPPTVELLAHLVNDKGVKKEVSRVMADVLRLSSEGRLKRVSLDQDNL